MAQLQEENQQLKWLVADLTLDKTMLQDVLPPQQAKSACRGPRLSKSGDAFAAWTDGGASGADVQCGGTACMSRAAPPRATYRYQSCLDPRTELRMRIREIAQARVRYGYRKIRVLLNREGWNVGKYLVYRLFCEEGLCLQRVKPAGKRNSARPCAEKFKATAPDQAWSMDFVADQLQSGTRFRSLTVVDVYTREAVAIEVGQSLKGEDVVRTLSKLRLERAVPKVLFCDNGSEFTSQAMDLWAYRNQVKIDFSRPGKPTDNAFVESFNGTSEPSA